MRLLRPLLLVAASLCTVPPCVAQWQLQSSGTAADLRGISSAGGGTAWASGAHGTVLRTEDSGFVWQGCTVPPEAQQLDFRAVQAFDAESAVVMSSGSGSLSRVYATTDGCVTWKLLFTNPDRDGFFDGLRASSRQQMTIMGDPVHGTFRVWRTTDGGATWKPESGAAALSGEGAFAASNQSLLIPASGDTALFGTGSPSGARIFRRCASCTPPTNTWKPQPMPMFPHAATAGIFAIAEGDAAHLVAVGGDYKQPESAAGTAAYSSDGGRHWTAAATLPRGYRSTVAYDTATKVWIAAGPNGTDVSCDGGRTWQPLKPAAREPADADSGWNAIALPFVVGPKGRIGRLREGALQPK